MFICGICCKNLLPPFFGFADFLYFFEAVKAAFVDPAANPGSFIPVIGACQIIRPERPGSALVRPDRINPANSFTIFFLKEYTVFCYRLFDNTCPRHNTLDIFSPQLAYGHFKKFSDKFHLRPSQPDISLSRPGTAIAAPGTLEMQTANIPFCLSHCFFKPQSSQRKL